MSNDINALDWFLDDLWKRIETYANSENYGAFPFSFSYSGMKEILEQIDEIIRQRDEALAENEGLKAKLVQVENEKDLAYKQIEFLQIINELAKRADN